MSRLASQEWVLLTYHLPREPSAPRLALWRQLKRLGVAQVSDGLVALPADARTREHFEWAAQRVEEAGGSATVWLARPTTQGEMTRLADGLRRARTKEYAQLAAAAGDAADQAAAERSRTLRRLRHAFREISRRDFFPPVERDRAAAALDDLAATHESDRAGSVGSTR